MRENDIFHWVRADTVYATWNFLIKAEPTFSKINEVQTKLFKKWKVNVRDASHNSRKITFYWIFFYISIYLQKRYGMCSVNMVLYLTVHENWSNFRNKSSTIYWQLSLDYLQNCEICIGMSVTNFAVLMNFITSL